MKQPRVKVHVHCTPPLMRSIHPHNFITIASIGFEICSRQKSRINLKKGNNSKLRQANVKVHVHCTPP